MKRVLALFAAAMITAAIPVAADAQGRQGKKDRDEQQQQRSKPDRGQRGGNDRGGDYGGRQEREIPLTQLISMVENRTGGQYVNADPRYQGGRKYYWMRLRFPGGRHQDYMVDAATGQF
ncbi:hypothetical protein GVN21_08070 [Caulobacter sp. SLTY]|uniref:PepSY domain-containing protein n=1 Tax=Caulobacter sp. SLTY TaxID=2683262 RepID=UPI001411E58E|nr:hypothetical protein [Caulobacter sp. SLTY]NBB15310.1 hypothetical protein [Caulobacter sp. SLTY]